MFCFIFEELSHIQPELRLSVVASQWKAIRTTTAADKYRAEAVACSTLKQASLHGQEAAKILQERLRQKLTNTVSCSTKIHCFNVLFGIV